MKKYSFLLCLLALIAWSCGDDEGNLSPSGLEKNWFVLEDSDDPIDHLRYEIYKETGFPIYYNDTVGSETRNFPGIGDYTYYEVLQVFYSPGSITPGNSIARYTLVSPERKNVKEVLEFMREEILPEIPDGTFLPSILLVDSLITPSGDTTVYKGFNTTVFAQVHNFHKMDEQTKDLMKGAFLASAITSKLSSNESEWLEENFYALSYAVHPDKADRMYSEGDNKRMVSPLCDTILHLEANHIGSFGMIGTNTPPSKVGIGNSLPANPYHPELWYMPTKEQDLQQYCQAILAFSQEDFMERYAKATILGYDQTWIPGQGTTEVPNESKNKDVEFPVVRAKYEVLKAKLQEYGFTFED